MDLAQEVGYLKGMQQATQQELKRLADAQESMATKEDVVNLRRELTTTFEEKLDEAVTKIQGASGAHRTLKDEPLWKTLLYSPVASTMITVLAMLAIAVLIFARDTGRDASSFVPLTPKTAPAP